MGGIYASIRQAQIIILSHKRLFLILKNASPYFDLSTHENQKILVILTTVAPVVMAVSGDILT
jgi:hypothetical protein